MTNRVQQASSYAIGVGLLKLLLGAGGLILFETQMTEIEEIDILATLIAGIILLLLGARLRWNKENPSAPLLGLIALSGLTFILALAAGRPIKIGVDFLLLGLFVLAYRSLPQESVLNRGAAEEEARPDAPVFEGVSSLEQQPKIRADCPVGDSARVQTDGGEEEMSAWSKTEDRRKTETSVAQSGDNRTRTIVKWAASVLVIVAISAAAYTARSNQIERLSYPRTFRTETPNFEVQLRTSYRSEGVLAGLFDDQGSIRYTLRVTQGKEPYDFGAMPYSDSITLRLLDKEGFLVTEWEFRLNDMTSLVAEDGSPVGVSGLGRRGGITADEYQDIARAAAVWSFGSR